MRGLGCVAPQDGTCLVCARPWGPFLTTLSKKQKKNKSFQVDKHFYLLLWTVLNKIPKMQNFVLSFFPKKCFGLKRNININWEIWVKLLVLSWGQLYCFGQSPTVIEILTCHYWAKWLKEAPEIHAPGLVLTRPLWNFIHTWIDSLWKTTPVSSPQGSSLLWANFYNFLF